MVDPCFEAQQFGLQLGQPTRCEHEGPFAICVIGFGQFDRVEGAIPEIAAEVHIFLDVGERLRLRRIHDLQVVGGDSGLRRIVEEHHHRHCRGTTADVEAFDALIEPGPRGPELILDPIEFLESDHLIRQDLIQLVEALAQSLLQVVGDGSHLGRLFAQLGHLESELGQVDGTVDGGGRESRRTDRNQGKCDQDQTPHRHIVDAPVPGLNYQMQVAGTSIDRAASELACEASTKERSVAFPDGIADFRSDTVTRPTPAMRRAMADAEVGDDVYGEDPTVNALEEEAAALVGKEAAVFVPSGSMGNLLGLASQSRPGDEVICVETAHVRNYEMSAAAAVAGLQFRTVPTPAGEMTVADIEAAIKQSGYQFPPVAMVSWENTHNWSGGTIVPLAMMQETSEVARRLGLRIHLDGARLWNAVAATGVEAATFAAQADTVQFCFSKGLGAPVGSILCGPAAVIGRARELRKRFGGGMRQVGVLAAAAKVGLDRRARLAEDHLLARRLAEGLSERHPRAVDLEQVQTNMVLVGRAGLPVSTTEFQTRLADAGVRVGSISTDTLRFVTHRNVDDGDVRRVLDVAETL